MNVNWIPVTLLTFWQIRASAFLCSYYIVVYVYRISAERKVKINAITAENMVTFGKNKSLLKLNWQCEVQLYDNCFNQLYERQLQRMVKYTQTICRQQPTIFWVRLTILWGWCLKGWWYFDNSGQMPSFPVLISWHTYEQSHQTGDQNGRISAYESGHTWKKKKPFWSLSNKLNINCIPIALLIFWQFREMLFFLFLKK